MNNRTHVACVRRIRSVCSKGKGNFLVFYAWLLSFLFFHCPHLWYFQQINVIVSLLNFIVEMALSRRKVDGNQCTLCGQRFAWSSNLRCMVHEGVRFPCNHCEKYYCMNYQLTDHIERAHPEMYRIRFEKEERIRLQRRIQQQKMQQQHQLQLQLQQRQTQRQINILNSIYAMHKYWTTQYLLK